MALGHAFDTWVVLYSCFKVPASFSSTNFNVSTQDSFFLWIFLRLGSKARMRNLRKQLQHRINNNLFKIIFNWWHQGPQDDPNWWARKLINHDLMYMYYKVQSWAPASQFALMHHRVIDAKANNRRVMRCLEFYLKMTRCRMTRQKYVWNSWHFNRLRCL